MRAAVSGEAFALVGRGRGEVTCAGALRGWAADAELPAAEGIASPALTVAVELELAKGAATLLGVGFATSAVGSARVASFCAGRRRVAPSHASAPSTNALANSHPDSQRLLG